MLAQEKQFYEDAQSFIDELLKDSPVTATFLGDHRYDGRLSDYTRTGLIDQRQRMGQWMDKFQACQTREWAVDSRIDQILMVQTLKRFIRGYDRQHFEQRHPGVGPDECLNGVFTLVMRDFAPLPERMKSILGRLRETRRVLEETKALIIPADVPELWAQISIDSARQGVGLFAGYIPYLAESTPEMKAEVVSAAQAAAAALNAYADWVEQEVLPHAQGNFAAGKELFDEILREDHMVAYDSHKLFDVGWRLYQHTLKGLVELAEKIDPGKTYKDILDESKQNHPRAEDLLDTYREWMDKARQFVIDHKIATLPEGECIRILPTPAFMRPVIPYAAYNMPGFLEKVQEGVFFVTPVDENASPEQVEARLRGHPLADIPTTALHEAYPGHHLQLVASNLYTSTPRKMGAFLSSLFVEGWAFYCEEMMEKMGFISEDVQKLARLQAQLWRAARIILDTCLHTRGMSYEDAVDFLVQHAGLERGDAEAEVKRYTQEPTQPQCYLMGKMQIMDIVAEYKRRYPKASMQEMHDAILHCGSLPPRLMRMRLIEAEK